MWSWLNREGARRWLDPTFIVVALAFLAVVGILLGSDSPILAILVLPIAAVLIGALSKSLARRPRLSLAAAYGATSTREKRGVRLGHAVVVLFVRNGERAGEGKNCKVEISTVAGPAFHLHNESKDAASEHLVADRWRIVWQPSDLGPGAERDLKLSSSEFPFDKSVKARVRVRADRMDPTDQILSLQVVRFDELNAEFSVTIE